MPLCRQASIENDVSVQQRANCIDDRILLVVSLHQHRVEGRYTSLAKASRLAPPGEPACSTPTAYNPLPSEALLQPTQSLAGPSRTWSASPPPEAHALPSAANASAIAVANNAARNRISGGSLDVETTITERLRPSSPITSRNSPTSRPRSPTSAITITSAAAPRHIIPSSVLLPTPLPPKIPSLCPRPQVVNASSARMPHPSGSRIGSRSSAFGADPSISTMRVERYPPIPSSGCPFASSTRPSMSGPTGTDGRPPKRSNRISQTNAGRIFSHHRQNRSPTKANDLACEPRPAGGPDLASISDRPKGPFGLDQISRHARHPPLPTDG